MKCCLQLFRIFLLPLSLLAGSGPVHGAEVDFNRDVRPLLSRYCFKCHGPDDGARKAKLRLDGREAALKGGRSEEPAVVPGKPDDSELVRRILADDPNRIMPPPATKATLSDAEK